jgi:hypothetical protein
MNASPEKTSRSSDRAGSYVGFRSPLALKEQLEEMARSNGRSLSAEVQTICEVKLAEQDGSGAGLLTALIGEVLVDLGPAAAAFGEPAPSAEVVRDWLLNPFAYDQAVQAINLILEAFRPPGDALPAHLQGPRLMPAAPVSGEGPPIEIDFNAQARDFGQGAARLALAAVADPNVVAPGKLRRLAAHIRQRFPDATERIRANLARKRESSEGEVK